jgi:hypothetical protein
MIKVDYGNKELTMMKSFTMHNLIYSNKIEWGA